MKINTKTRYGIRVLLELSLNKDKEGIFQKDISKNQDISFKYLDPIIAVLKSAGLVTMVAGKKSGYKLVRDPGEISVYNVYNAFNPEFSVVACVLDDNFCKKSHYCAVRSMWYGLNNQIITYLKSVTINDLAKNQIEFSKKEEEIMFEI